MVSAIIMCEFECVTSVLLLSQFHSFICLLAIYRSKISANIMLVMKNQVFQ